MLPLQPAPARAKNRLVIIGWMGTKRAYLNVERDEAIRRYCESEGGGTPLRY